MSFGGFVMVRLGGGLVARVGGDRLGRSGPDRLGSACVRCDCRPTWLQQADAA